MNRRDSLKLLAGTAVLGPMLRPRALATVPSPSERPGPGVVTPYRYSPLCPAGAARITAGGEEVFVFRTSAGDFGAFATTGATEIRIEFPSAVGAVRVSPKRHGLKPAVEGSRLVLTIPGPVHLLIEVEGQTQLHLFADLPDTERPEPNAPGVRFFAAGQIHEAGEIRLRSDERVYIEGGAVVRGCIRATSAKNVRIGGRGVLDGGLYRPPEKRRRTIMLEDCEDAVISGITLIEPTAWMLVLGACRRATVRQVKLLGEVGSSDGVDIVGSSQVRVDGCYFRNGDDCVAIKSLDLRPHDSTATIDFTRDVEDVEVTGCTFMSYRGGQAMEIGHEIRCDYVRNVRFSDCDVLAVRQYGAPFGIHNADRAMVRDIVFENIRVEHYYDKLVDFRIVHTRWSKDRERGQVRNVLLRNIQVSVSEYNPGYSVSIIGGFSPRHTIEGVRFVSFLLRPVLYESRFSGFANRERVAQGPDDIDLYTRYASDITFS